MRSLPAPHLTRTGQRPAPARPRDTARAPVHAGRVSPDPHVLADGHFPTPFTADEIRAATPRGRTLTVHQLVATMTVVADEVVAHR